MTFSSLLTFEVNVKVAANCKTKVVTVFTKYLDPFLSPSQ